MNENKNAVPVVEAGNGEGDQKAVGSFALSSEKYSTGKSTLQGIVALLPCGEENAISTQALVQLAGCSSVRQLQKQIEAERAQGALILSSSAGGYFLPADRAEIRRYEVTLRRRALSTLRTLRVARQALKICEGQEELLMREAGDGGGAEESGQKL